MYCDNKAQVVRRIFRMAICGKGTYQIARVLTDEKIMRPSAYIALRDGYEMPGPEDKYSWHGIDGGEYIRPPGVQGIYGQFSDV